MIEGLHADVTGTELKTMLEGRKKYHEDKRAFYERQRIEIEKAERALADEAKSMGKTHTRSPLEAVDDALRKHDAQIIYYTFMAAHVNLSETYRLSDHDLVRLGVTSERW